MILVKNLPAGVEVSELDELFSRHGSLGRVLLPPSGLTAVIEFLEPTEAKRAFTRLAYSKVSAASPHFIGGICQGRDLSTNSALSLQFHHVPLYLEWAPVGVFVAAKPQTGTIPH